MNILNKFLALSICAKAVEAATQIKNSRVIRSIDLMEAGSNLVTFNTDLTFQNPGKEPYYYYTVAKDFEWSFLDLQVLT